MTFTELATVTGPNGAIATLPVLHVSPRGTFAVVDLRGSDHRGTVDVFHVGTGKRATPVRHFESIRTRSVCVRLADWLDLLDPVDHQGELKIGRLEYHQAFDAWVREA
ncbi:hypothetical protein [Microbacterium gorillae]|uniref:hypothetical protein n=1 Tax=Microbacterium gorillae TaxID=1231063 RepID=UPI003D98EEF2